MKCFFAISNFLEVISSLFHSVVFLYFFALIAEEGFLISSCFSLELCIQMLISFLFSLNFSLLFFSQLLVRPPQTAILLFCISFPWGWFSGIPQKKWSSHHGQQKSPKCSTWMQSQKLQNDLCSFPRQVT